MCAHPVMSPRLQADVIRLSCDTTTKCYPLNIADPGGGPAMTINLHARDNFEKGDLGCAIGHRVTKVIGETATPGSVLVMALQEVKAGDNGWFERK
jgi:hypothetical protein